MLCKQEKVLTAHIPENTNNILIDRTTRVRLLQNINKVLHLRQKIVLIYTLHIKTKMIYLPELLFSKSFDKYLHGSIGGISIDKQKTLSHHSRCNDYP